MLFRALTLLAALAVPSPLWAASQTVIGSFVAPLARPLGGTGVTDSYGLANVVGTAAVVSVAGTSTAATTTVVWSPSPCGDGTINLPASVLDNEPHIVINGGGCPSNTLTVQGNGHNIGAAPSVVVPTGSQLSVRYLVATGTWNTGGISLNAALNLSDLASASVARTNLGLGTMAIQNSSAVAITGGTVGGVAITGGTIDNAPIGGVTPSTVTSTQLINNISNLVTTQTTPNGSVGEGGIYFNMTRTGGYGQYGNMLSLYTVTSATPTGQFDSGITSWATNTNLTGGQVFGSWVGANTPAFNKGETYSGGAAIGQEVNCGNRWNNFGLQTALGGTRYTVCQQIVADVIPANGADNSVALTSFATGSPAVFTLTGHGFYVNMGVVFSGAAGITGITDGTTYYVVSGGFTANDFEVAATIGGIAINTSGTPSGTLKVLPSWPGSFGTVYAPSIHGHQIYVPESIAANTIAPGGYAHYDNGSSVATNQPEQWAHVTGRFHNGLDFTGATLSGNLAVALGASQAIYLDGAQISGLSSALSIATASTATGILKGNSSVATFEWNASGSTPQIGFFGTAPVAQTTGYGTPTNVSKTSSLPGTAATLAQVGGTLAALITELKANGLVGN